MSSIPALNFKNIGNFSPLGKDVPGLADMAKEHPQCLKPVVPVNPNDSFVTTKGTSAAKPVEPLAVEDAPQKGVINRLLEAAKVGGKLVQSGEISDFGDVDLALDAGAKLKDARLLSGLVQEGLTLDPEAVGTKLLPKLDAAQSVWSVEQLPAHRPPSDHPGVCTGPCPDRLPG